MIVDTGVYVVSLVQVLIACIIRDFFVPLLVWRKYLKNKTYGYRFWFCVITQASLQINLVLLFGFLGVCNRFTIIAANLLIYSLIIWNYSDKKFFQHCKNYAGVLWEAYKEEMLINYVLRKTVDWLKDFWRTLCRWPIWSYIRRNWIQVLLLISLVIYNIWFLTYNVMRYHCYQFSDIPVHQSWIYALEHGTLFSDGIYPFGMHAMIYIIRIIFQFNLREIMLYAGTYQTVIMMMGLYLLAREIFYAKYTPVAVVLIISLMLNQARFAAALPQEAGMYAVIGVAYFMLRYLHTDRKKFTIARDSKIRSFFRVNAYVNRRYINSDSTLLILCIALVIAYHFYTAIAACFLMVAIGLGYIPKIFKKQYFIPLFFCGIIGVMIAVLPFVSCLAKGIPFQESMNWATSVIKGEKWQGSDTDYQTQLSEAQNQSADNASSNFSKSKAGDERKAKVDYSAMTKFEILKFFYRAMLDFGRVVMFGSSATKMMFGAMLAGSFCASLLLLRKKTRIYGHDYIALIINMLILFIIGSVQTLGFIELIAPGRASTFAEPFVGFIYMMPVDFVIRIFGGWKNRVYHSMLNSVSLITCGLIAILIIQMGWYHDYFDVNQAYYNESEYLLRHIKQSYAKDTYTIVSPTEEYYDILDYGYHTELSEFMNMVNGDQKRFTFPTKYVFFFVEKRALQDYTYGPPVDISLKYAAMHLKYLANSQDYYFQRAIIESQAFYWAQKARKIYPRNFTVYYEDDIYVAYILEQNTYSPYDLRVDYLSDYAAEIKANGWDKEENTIQLNKGE